MLALAQMKLVTSIHAFMQLFILEIWKVIDQVLKDLSG